ncbi:MAG TPA: response regulator [Candidatus Dormibacteraeota bacterium]|nr:response regulator [Candidatus Dormibacteraeota bacterium]
MPAATSDAPVRVLIVDADHRVRESLADLLGLSDTVSVVGLAGHVGAAFDGVGAESPDVVVLDPRLPDVEAGLALIALLDAAEPRPHLLVLSSLGCELDVLARGADRFLAKNVAPQDLIDAIVALARPRRGGPDERDARARAAATPRRLAALRAAAGDPLSQARTLQSGPRLVPGWAGARGGRC